MPRKKQTKHFKYSTNTEESMGQMTLFGVIKKTKDERA